MIVAIAALAGAVFAGYKMQQAQKSGNTTDADKFKKLAMAAGAVAALAGFMYYRKSKSIDTLANQYLVSLNNL